MECDELHNPKSNQAHIRKMNVKSVLVEVDGKSNRWASRVYRVLNSTVFYLGQPLTAVAAIIELLIHVTHLIQSADVDNVKSVVSASLHMNTLQPICW